MYSKKRVKEIIDYYDSTYFEYKVVLGLRSHFGMHYGYYDRNNRSYHQASINLNRVLAEKARILKGDNVLDAGCGIGGSSIWLAKYTGADVVGISLSKKQIAIARNLAKKKGLEAKTKFLVRDFRATSLPKDSFDVVWAIESACYSENKRDFIREIYRLLKPGGRLVVADGFLKRTRMNQDEKALMKKWLSAWRVPNLSTVSRFSKDMSEVGFKKINYLDVTKNVLPFSKWLREKAFLLIPIAYILRLLGIYKKVHTDNGIGAISQYEALDKGLWEYAIILGEK